MKMKVYETPKVELAKLESSDIITESPNETTALPETGGIWDLNL